MSRVPLLRYDEDGSVHEGTAEVDNDGTTWHVHDLQDMDGNILILPPWSHVEIPVPELKIGDHDTTLAGTAILAKKRRWWHRR